MANMELEGAGSAGMRTAVRAGALAAALSGLAFAARLLVAVFAAGFAVFFVVVVFRFINSSIQVLRVR